MDDAPQQAGTSSLGYGLNAAIGQGATTVTVLQLALAYAALANGGTLYQPQLVRAVETSNGTVVQEFSPRVRRQIDIKPENLRMVQKALEAGVTEEGGTSLTAYNGSGLRELGIDVAGKTGTAQVTHHLVRGRRGRAELVLQPRARVVRRLRARALARDRGGGASSSTAATAASTRRPSPSRPSGVPAVRPRAPRARGAARRRDGERQGPGAQAPGQGAVIARDDFSARVRDHFDWPLFISAALIAVLGVINLYSATSVYPGARAELYVSQIQWLAVGGILGGIVARASTTGTSSASATCSTPSASST